MDTHNYIRNIILEVIDRNLASNKDICQSQQYRSNIENWILERLLPKYQQVSSDTVYIRTQSIDYQLKIDVALELDKAIIHFSQPGSDRES